MQTFLPYPDYVKSAKTLDYRRLGKQRVEAWQILLTLQKGPTLPNGKKTPWYNHPAVQMWKGFENALIEYGIAMCDEWISRGYNDSLRDKFWHKYPWHQSAPKPIWFGSYRFHLSHRSNLLRKDRDFYLGKFGVIRDDRQYVWPTQVINS